MDDGRMSGGWLRLALLLLLLVVLPASLPAQIGPRPGTQRRNYPLGGLGVPMPELPEVNFKGNLEKIDNKSIILKLDDGRTANFQRSRKTKFFKDGKEIKATDLKIGDHLSLDAQEDPQAFLDALKVTFYIPPPAGAEGGEASKESAQNTPQTIQYDSNGRPTLSKRILERPESPESPRSGSPQTERPQPGRPVLRRSPDSQSPVGLPGIPPPDAAGAIAPSQSHDPLIDKARAAVVASLNSLPNFAAREIMKRSSRDANESDWKAIDTVSAEVAYADRTESYRDIRIDNEPTDAKEMSGSWPVARLVSTLSDLLSPAIDAHFQAGGDSNLPGLEARVYDFTVAAESSQWIMRMGEQSINAAYAGSVWIDKESGRVLRLEMQARDLPAGFPLNRVETVVEYAPVTLGQETVLLPMHVETIGCQQASHTCSRSVIDFQNYRP